MANTIIIFGASGDLTSRKLVPALYKLAKKGRLPQETRIVGMSRTKFTHEAWREELAKTTAEFVGSAFDSDWQKFAANIYYQPGDIDNPEHFAALKKLLAELEGPGQSSRLYYLSMAPKLYEPTIAQLGAAGMASDDNGPRRIVIEKPFGTATLAAFIGAGGLGEPIVTGLQLADTRRILSGALPAALLAVLVDLALAGVERLVRPRGVVS
jgi:glucose-6-phosphate 1-dehydrogenase